MVLDHLEVEQAVCLGHSMGTQVCLESYRERPDRVKGLVLICGSFGRVTHTFHGTDVLSQVLPSIIEGAQRHRGLTRAVWGRMPPRLAFQIARLSGEVDRAAIREEDFVKYWEHITVMDPDVFLAMLRLAGEHSAYLRGESAEESADAMVAPARALEEGREFSKAIDAYLALTAARTKNHDFLEEVWENAVKLAMNHVPERIAEVVAATPRTEIMTQNGDYLHAEVTSRIFRFVDDLEIALAEAELEGKKS